MPGDETYRQKEQKGNTECLQRLPAIEVYSEIEKSLKKVKKILVVMLTYNLLDWTKLALDSIRSFHDYDIFVVDNESTDGTQEYLKEKGIEFISKRTSVAAAQNIGIQKLLAGEYDYLLLVNNDLILHREAIDNLVRCLETSGADAAMSTETGGMPPWLIDTVPVVEEKWEEVIDIPAGSYSCTLFRRSAVERVGTFDERFWPRYIEDNDYTLRLRASGGRFVKASGALYYHVLGGVFVANAGEKKDKDHHWVKNIGYYVEKWGRDDPLVKKQLGFRYRYFGVYLETGKWKKLIRHPILTLQMYFLKVTMGFIYLTNREVQWYYPQWRSGKYGNDI
jgi:GT2 family glycosyltransferase